MQPYPPQTPEASRPFLGTDQPLRNLMRLPKGCGHIKEGRDPTRAGPPSPTSKSRHPRHAVQHACPRYVPANVGDGRTAPSKTRCRSIAVEASRPSLGTDQPLSNLMRLPKGCVHIKEGRDPTGAGPPPPTLKSPHPRHAVQQACPRYVPANVGDGRTLALKSLRRGGQTPRRVEGSRHSAGTGVQGAL
jgi:hypothetical protein